MVTALHQDVSVLNERLRRLEAIVRELREESQPTIRVLQPLDAPALRA